MALITDDQITRLSTYIQGRENLVPAVSLTGIEFCGMPTAILDDLLSLAEQFYTLSFDYDTLHHDYHSLEEELFEEQRKLAKITLVLAVLIATDNPAAPTIRKILEGSL